MKNTFFFLVLITLILSYFIPPISFNKNIIPILLSISLFISFQSILNNTKKIKIEKINILSFSLRVIFPTTTLIALKLFTNLDWYIISTITLILSSPNAIGAVLYFQKINKNSPTVLVDTILNNLLSIVYIPIYLFILGYSINTSAVIHIFFKLFTIVGIPLIVIKFIPFNKEILQNRVVSNFNTLTILLIVFLATNNSLHELSNSSHNIAKLFLISGTLVIINYSIGFIIDIIFKINNTGPMLYGYRNTALTIWIIFNFTDKRGVIFVVLYILLQHIANSMLLLRKKQN